MTTCTSLITMEPSELKASVRRIVPISLQPNIYGVLVWCGEMGSLVWCKKVGGLVWCEKVGGLVWCGEVGGLVYFGK